MQHRFSGLLRLAALPVAVLLLASVGCSIPRPSANKGSSDEHGKPAFSGGLVNTKAEATAHDALQAFLGSPAPADEQARGLYNQVRTAFWADYAHNVDVTFDPQQGSFHGTDRIKVHMLQGTPKIGISLRMENKIDEVALADGTKLEREVDFFSLPADKQAAGSEFELVVKFSGVGPQIGSLLANDITITNRIIVASGFFPRGWGGPMAGRFTVHLPKGWHSGMPGHLEKSADGEETWLIDHPVPQVTLLAQPAPLVSKQINGRELHFLGPSAQNSAVSDRWLKVAGDTLDYYADYYNRPYPYGELTVVELKDIGGNIGAFSQPGVLTTELGLPDYSMYRLIVHELGHEWWGDLVVPMGNAKMFLMESLTEYNSWKAKEYLKYTTMQESATQTLLAYDRLARPSNEEALKDMSGSDMSDAGASTYYFRGPQIWRMLNLLMGDDKFRELMVRFASHNWWEPLHYNQFRQDAIAIGGPEVGPFIDMWIDHPAEPSLEYRDVKVTRSGGSYTITGVIRQVPLQGEGPWKLQADLGVYREGQLVPAKVVPLPLTALDTPFTVAVDFPPSGLRYDPLFKTMFYKRTIFTIPR